MTNFLYLEELLRLVGPRKKESSEWRSKKIDGECDKEQNMYSEQMKA